MQFVYKPEGADPRKFEFDPTKLMNPEAEAIERVTKMTFGEWGTAVTKGSMTAVHALLWVMLKRSDPTLAYDAVQFSLADVDFELSDEESAEALATLEKRAATGEELTDGDRVMLAKLRESAPTEAPDAPDAEDDEEPTEGFGPKALVS